MVCQRLRKRTLSSDLKILKAKASSTNDSIKHILQQLNEIKNQLCIPEQLLISQLRETSHQDPPSQLSTVITDSNEYTYTVATSNKYETLVEENRSIVESIPPNTQPNPSSTTTSSPTATRTQPPISQPKKQLASIKGTGAVVRRFDHKRNTVTQVRPKPLCKQTNNRCGNEGTKPVHQPHSGKK